MSDRWQHVWSSRPAEPQTSLLCKLMHADGYLSGFSPSSEASFRAFVDHVKQRANMQSGDSVFEIGCGAGAFLLPLVEAGLQVGGLDFAGPQVELAQQSLPSGRFVHAEAAAFDGQPVDHVLSNGVFLYFPTTEYADKVLSSAMGAARRSVVILDTPDAALREQAESYRMQTMGPEAYRESYSGLEHLYLSRDWFQERASAAGWRCVIEDQTLADHPQARFRFNVFLSR